MQIKNITIIGCGWLGCILGEALCKNGYSVHGSARSSAGLSRIINAGISQFYLDLNVNDEQINIYYYQDNSFLKPSIQQKNVGLIFYYYIYKLT